MPLDNIDENIQYLADPGSPTALDFDQISTDFQMLDQSNRLPTISFSNPTTFVKLTDVFSAKQTQLQIASLDASIDSLKNDSIASLGAAEILDEVAAPAENIIPADDLLDDVPEVLDDGSLQINGCYFFEDSSVEEDKLFYLDTSVLNIDIQYLIKSFISIILQLACFDNVVSYRNNIV